MYYIQHDNCIYTHVHVMYIHVHTCISHTFSSEDSRELGMEAHALLRLPSLIRGWLNDDSISEEWCTVCVCVCVCVCVASLMHASYIIYYSAVT